MNRQRGFLEGPLLYLVLGIALLGALAAVIAAWKSYVNVIDKKGYQRGVAEVTSLWGQATIKADAEERARRQALQMTVNLEVEKRQAAEAKAGNHYANWQREKENAKRKGLTVCNQTPAGVPDVRFTSVFVASYDAAYTSKDGQPLYADPIGTAAPAATAGAAVSPYGPSDLLDVHGINAERHSACIRDYNALIDVVLKLKTEWELKAPAAR